LGVALFGLLLSDSRLVPGFWPTSARPVTPVATKVAPVVRNPFDDGDEEAETLLPGRRPREPSPAAAAAQSGGLLAAYIAAAVGIVYANAYVLGKWPFAATLTCRPPGGKHVATDASTRVGERPFLVQP